MAYVIRLVPRGAVPGWTDEGGRMESPLYVRESQLLSSGRVIVHAAVRELEQAQHWVLVENAVAAALAMDLASWHPVVEEGLP